MNRDRLHRILFGAFFMVLSSAAFCQNEPVTSTENSNADIKLFDNFVSVQVNPLIQQIFNFGEADDVNNPFLLKYTLRHNETGLALNLGFGVDLEDSENNEGFKTNNTGFDMRAGIGYQRKVGERFELGVGADFVYGYDKLETFSLQVIGFGQGVDSTLTTSVSKTTKVGGGLQASLAYVFAKRFAIGTEMTLYYLVETEKFNAVSESHIIQPGLNDVIGISSTNEKTDGTSFKFRVPIAIFLAVKF